MLLLNHVGLATRNAADLIKLLQTLTGGAATPAEDVGREGVRVRFYSAGQTRLELLEALDGDSPLARYIARHGEGLHHIAFTVSDIERQLERLRSAGFTPLSPHPRLGAGGKHIFFLHPKTTGRVLIEFCQPVRQWAVSLIGTAPDLKAALLRTGHVRLVNTPRTSLIAAGNSPLTTTRLNTCLSLVLFHRTGTISIPSDLSCPILICASDLTADTAVDLRSRWPQARLAILPVNTPADVWSTLLTDFWTSHD